MKIEISDLVARCLERMIGNEIEDQKQWKENDIDLQVRPCDIAIRDEIIKQMTELLTQIRNG